MNPMTNVKNIKKLSEQELNSGSKTSWHDQYKDSAWIFVGGLPYDLSEGDIICIFCQYGEIVNLNLVRDKITGKSKGFCFICYEDQKSTVLAVDNLNGIKILSRTIRVDHVNDYKPPKDNKYTDDETKKLRAVGCAPGTEFGSILPVKTEDIKQESDSSKTNNSKEKKRKHKEKKVKKEKKKKKPNWLFVPKKSTYVNVTFSKVKN
uniref:RNA-binding motif protein, X-linked 2 n=1 Tax=Cacopsylla melanoneura TaxID=428564 RepID=A0A8D8WHR7_9HEMI